MRLKQITFDKDALTIIVRFEGAEDLKITRDTLEISYFSGGSGGQNVNRHLNGVRLIYRIPSSHRRASQKTRELIARSMAQRSQPQNLLLAFQQLAQKLHQYFYLPPARQATKIPKKSKEKRLGNKKHRSQVKALRKRVSGDL
ncbi:MAG: peptide chain release factor-like protein [Candidatus Peregrinibacteria bacterium]